MNNKKKETEYTAQKRNVYPPLHGLLGRFPSYVAVLEPPCVLT